MNKGQAAHLSEEMSGEQSHMNLGSARGQQQLHVSLSHSGMDPQFKNMRIVMKGRIVEYLTREKKNAAQQSIEQLANRLENEIYKLHPMKADYHVTLKQPTEQLLQATVRILSTHGHQRKKMLNQTQTSSMYGTVVPPPDAMSNDCWNPSTCLQQNSTTSSISPMTFPVSMQRQITHMVATPGFSHQHTLRANPGYLNVAGYLNGDLNDVAQVQQKQQKPSSVQQPFNHVDSGVHSRMLENFSSYDLSDPKIDGGVELHGSNMLLKNRDAVSEAFINLPTCCTYPDKALKQEFNLPTSSGSSVSENFYSTISSALTTKRTNSGLFVSQTTKQQLQPKPCKKSEVLDGKERVNFRKSKLSQEQLLQRPHQLKSYCPSSQYMQNQEVLKQCQLGSFSKETRDNEKRDQMSRQLAPQNIHSGAPSDSQQLLPAHVTNIIWMNNKIQDDCCQGTVSQDLAQQLVSSDCSMNSIDLMNCTTAGCSMNSIDPKLSELPTEGPEQVTENIKCYHLQLRWLLLLIHAKSCPGPLSSCESPYCVGAQDVLKHFKNCQRKDCSYRYCRQSKMLICHYRNCVNKHCPVCSKAKESLHRYANQSNKRSHSEPTFNMEPYTIERVIDGIYDDRMETKLVAVETFDDQPPVSKRIKQSMYSNVSDGVDVHVSQACSKFVLQKAHPKNLWQDKKSLPKQELNMKTDIRLPQTPAIINFGTDEKIGTVQSYVTAGIPSKLNCHFEDVDMKNANGTTDVMLSNTGKTKRKGISLMETFTPEQVYEHISSLRQWVGQSKAKAEKNQAMGHSKNENSCQLCKLERLTFEPTPIYCSPCGSRIKRNAPYYIATLSESGRYNFCASCYTESRSDSIFVGSIQLLKSKLEKRRNDDELEEGWVECDKCKRWQHQICALFNAKRNDEEKEAEFTCHYCYLQEIKHGLRAPLPQSTVLGAKDLPRTLLSNHIEDRLFKRLKEERQDRAKKFGKFFDEVPGVEGLIVRVVSSVDKILEVKPKFLEIFQEENYPTEFPYKSKAILLFQRIEGVEVCIFGMYVQEYGTECAFPNQRRVYLSYLDSVKYFRPEIETVSGEALRTFVYHEILIGYLQYCKQRGFTSCYIWACPPLKGEDYIMYCHPEIQKTPKSDKLREWYLSMLQKATKEGIVVERTNLYDHFFIRKRECKAKVTAARLPYFDGDYWPGAAEDMLNKICLPEGDRNIKKNRKIKSIITKRDLKAVGVTDLCGGASKDSMLMQKLGEFIYPMKEDFIMVHLQYSCSHCCILMVSGRRWQCNQCKSFYICDKCYIVERQREQKYRHPSNSPDLHMLHEVQIVGVPKDTKDRDDIIESEFFDTRQAFLSLCQGNHYQYDTLRSAKHSSMMVLYHLHNPTEPAFITTCNVCDNDIKTGQGWRCKECDYDECAACYQKYGGRKHPHRLTKHSAGADMDVQNTRQKHVQTARKMLEVLTHAMACRHSACQHPYCRKMKALFHHGSKCQQRMKGGCPLCKKMWGIIHFHVRVCKESQCRIPRCRDLKDHMRRLQQQSESRRRAAVNEMMMQRAAEAGVKVEQ